MPYYLRLLCRLRSKLDSQITRLNKRRFDRMPREEQMSAKRLELVRTKTWVERELLCSSDDSDRKLFFENWLLEINTELAVSA